MNARPGLSEAGAFLSASPRTGPSGEGCLSLFRRRPLVGFACPYHTLAAPLLVALNRIFYLYRAAEPGGHPAHLTTTAEVLLRADHSIGGAGGSYACRH